MFSSVFICLTLLNFFSFSASADNSKCTSLFLEDLADQTQSSIVITLLENAKNLLEDAKKYAAVKTKCPEVETIDKKPIDCAHVMEKNSSAGSGVYKIWPHGRGSDDPVEVYCDMEDDGGAWTVIQRRGDFGSDIDYFFKDWQSYKVGFGDRTKDYWLGNDNIFALTNQRSNIVKFTLSDWEKNETHATYEEFWIDDESLMYTMHVSGYHGTAGDSFSGTNGYPFSTEDQDNDEYSESCAVIFKGAWWYSNCHDSNLNGMYLKGAHESYADGVEWYTFRGIYYSLKDTVIKIRPKGFHVKPAGAGP